MSAPSLSNVLLEARALAEWPLGLLASALHRQPSTSTKQGVLLLPGFLTNEWSMSVMERVLAKKGFEVLPWRWGLNMGPDQQTLSEVVEDLQSAHERLGKVHLVGWSLGGVLAYMLAQDNPHLIKSVTTFGSPLRPDWNASHLNTLFSKITDIQEHDTSFWAKRLRVLPKVPVTSIVSKTDGLVSWSMGCIPVTSKSETLVVEHASHLGMPANPLVLNLVLDRLNAAQHKKRPAYEASGVFKSLVSSLPAPALTRAKKSPK